MATDQHARVRASDGEREDYATILRSAMTEGRLSLEEGEQRLAAVYGSRFRDELPPQTADLPDGGKAALFDTPAARQRWRRQARRHFAGHAGLVAVVAAALVGLFLLSHAHFFWPAIPLFFLSLGLVRHARWSWLRSGPWSGRRSGGWPGLWSGGWGDNPWTAATRQGSEGGHWTRG